MREDIIKAYNIDSATETRFVQHCDFMCEDAKGSMKMTEHGFLAGMAPVAKVGIMTYHMADGSTLREFVPPETLFNASSMDSLKMKPMTDNHPPERKVNSGNASFRQIGYTGETVKRDGDNKLFATMVLTHQSAIDSVMAGKQELSPGYEAELAMESGTYKGEPYDAVQLSRRYNHVAVVDSARGGADIRMHMDGIEIEKFEMWNADELSLISFVEESLDAELGDAKLSTEKRKGLSEASFCGPNRSFPVPDCAHVTAALRLIGRYGGPGSKEKILSCVEAKAKRMGCDKDKPKNDNNNPSKEKPMVKVTIDGIEYEAAPEVAKYAARLLDAKEKSEKELAEEKKISEALKGEKDAKDAEIKKAKAEKQDAIDAAVSERLELERVANFVLDSVDAKMTNRDLKGAIIAKKVPELKIDANTTVEYIDAALSVIKAGFTKEENDNISRQTREMNNNDAAGVAVTNMDAVAKAKKAMEERQANAYKREKK